MINTVRQEILQQLGRLSELAPDLRFGQMIADMAFLAAGPWDQTLWKLEDELLLVAIRQQVADLSQRSQSVAELAATNGTMNVEPRLRDDG
jgi:hypothetical protein